MFGAKRFHQYIFGRQVMLVADALSRLHPDDGDDRSELEDAIEMAVHSLVTSLPVSDQKMVEIKKPL